MTLTIKLELDEKNWKQIKSRVTKYIDKITKEYDINGELSLDFDK
jgi:hypothetical protein